MQDYQIDLLLLASSLFQFLMLLALSVIGYFLRKHVDKVETLEKEQNHHSKVLDVHRERMNSNKELVSNMMKLHVDTINSALLDIRSAIARLEAKIDIKN